MATHLGTGLFIERRRAGLSRDQGSMILTIPPLAFVESAEARVHLKNHCSILVGAVEAYSMFIKTA